MQDEVSERVVGLMISGGRATAQTLKSVIFKYIEHVEKVKKETEQKVEKKVSEKLNEKQHGKQSLQKLMDQGAQLVNVEITDNNIKDFDKVARKYQIDYSLVKDKSHEPPQYYAFFKARDEAVMMAAFKEYTGYQEKEVDKFKDQPSKVPIREQLEINQQKVAERDKAKQLSKDKVRSRNRSLTPAR